MAEIAMNIEGYRCVVICWPRALCDGGGFVFSSPYVPEFESEPELTPAAARYQT